MFLCEEFSFLSHSSYHSHLSLKLYHCGIVNMSTSSKQKAKVEKFYKKREEGFDLGSVPHATLKNYSALHDPNMRHYFENPNIQRHLYTSGQIDSHGRVINLHKNKTKLHILDREFKEAELSEMRKLKEEEEMRVSNVIYLIVRQL